MYMYTCLDNKGPRDAYMFQKLKHNNPVEGKIAWPKNKISLCQAIYTLKIDVLHIFLNGVLWITTFDVRFLCLL